MNDAALVETDGGIVMPREREQRMPAQQQPGDLIGAIAAAASNPSTDVEKMERLMGMHERLVAQQAQQAYQQALAEMQPELPVVKHRGNAANRYTFALWEDIHRAMVPVMSRHGFSLFFKVETNDQIRVQATLAHAGGHREDTSITLPADGSGSKNAVQAVASSVAYGKRYTAGALLNFATTGEDDDACEYIETIGEAKAGEVRDLLLDAEIPEGDLLSVVSRKLKRTIESVEAIPATEHARCVQWIEKRKAAA